MLPDDDVAALLAAETGAGDLHALEDVLVADGGAHDGPAGGLDGVLQAAVREDGDDERPPGERAPGQPLQGEDPEHLVPVHDPAGRVDRDEPIRVAVQGESDVGTVLGDGPGEAGRIRRPAVEVDVRAVRVRR